MWESIGYAPLRLATRPPGASLSRTVGHGRVKGQRGRSSWRIGSAGPGRVKRSCPRPVCRGVRVWCRNSVHSV